MEVVQTFPIAVSLLYSVNHVIRCELGATVLAVSPPRISDVAIGGSLCESVSEVAEFTGCTMVGRSMPLFGAGLIQSFSKVSRVRETLENPGQPRENTRVSAGTDWVQGQQAAQIR